MKHIKSEQQSLLVFWAQLNNTLIQRIIANAGTLTCAGHLPGQRLGWPNTHPCVHGKASTRSPQSESLEAESVTARPACNCPPCEEKEGKMSSDLQPAHILTSLGSWSTEFAWRRRRPSSHRWRRTGAEQRAGSQTRHTLKQVEQV